MSRATILKLASLFLFTFLLVAGTAHADAVVLDLRTDPSDPTPAGPALTVEGPGLAQFAFVDAGAAFPSDPRGALRVTYDAASPSTRASVPLDHVYTEDDDFLFGAVLTIRSEGFHADPFGFQPITISLLNSATTGFDRTGDPSDYRADTFDTVEIGYFPQVSPLFGGPYLSPAVFGEAIGDDAFMNFAYGSSQFEIPKDLPVAVIAEHVADEAKLVVTVYGFGEGGRPVPLPGGRVEASLASLTGFAVDSLAVTAYEDGFNGFSPSGSSLHADVDFHRLIFAPGRLGTGDGFVDLASLLRMAGSGVHGLQAR